MINCNGNLDISYYKCKICSWWIENDDQTLCGHIQLHHENVFKEIEDLDVPDIVDEYYTQRGLRRYESRRYRSGAC